MNHELINVVQAAWPETTAENLDKTASKDIRLLFTLCPLYLPGSLSESGLMMSSASIECSRVARKWKALTEVITGLDNYFKAIEGSLSLSAVFASKGVLLAAQPNIDHEVAIMNHNDIYQEALDKFCQGKKIALDFTNYHQLGVKFPDFVNPNSRIPVYTGTGDSKNMLVNAINAHLQAEQIPSQLFDNKANRRLVDKIAGIEGVGSSGAFWLITGYMAFDYMIPTLASENGLYLATERFEPLFGISHFTEGLKVMPKLKIKA
jgi:hypothetical protein